MYQAKTIIKIDKELYTYTKIIYTYKIIYKNYMKIIYKNYIHILNTVNVMNYMYSQTCV